ncbi:MAG: glycoside hydrolase family 127 protein [Armatimonadota bacterium]|nr:glycoside hydrolase family 127 protein [Armatimonadota bacterium]MDW8026282.1 glycoside hydrolase family 127 protein [Armatimonadota bacterium]
MTRLKCLQLPHCGSLLVLACCLVALAFCLAWRLGCAGIIDEKQQIATNSDRIRPYEKDPKAKRDFATPSITSITQKFNAKANVAGMTKVKPRKQIRTKAPLVPNKAFNACQPVAYEAQCLDPKSYLGRRVDINFRIGLLKTFDVNLYLSAYGKKPKWPVGEYLGKFVQGLCAMYRYTGEVDAKKRLDKIITTWRRVQAPDGWLGSGERFRGWDIWEHKYVLLGLLDYYALTGDSNALEAACKIGDLLCANIGPNLGDIMQSGHWAMGSASILEPMVYLYRFTGERRYLDFCRYIVEAFEGPTGPKLISILTTGSKRVCDIEDPWAMRPAREIMFAPRIGQVRNRSKAYEMLSCIIGLARMYQLTGKPEYLTAVANAWQDISANRLYIAGSSGADECFKDDHCLPAETYDNPAEGCVTAHWIYLSRVLFEITGDVRYADSIENALYNYLLASQRPQDCYQSYYTPLNGIKNFAHHDPTGKVPPCCISSVMREIARTPEAVWTKFNNGGLGVVLYQKCWMEDTIKTSDGKAVFVRVEMDTDFPLSGEVILRIQPQRKAKFRFALRVPGWAKDFRAIVAGRVYVGKPGQFLNLERNWKPGDTVKITIDMSERLIPGGASYPGHFAFMYGPQVLTLVARQGAESNLDVAMVNAKAGAKLIPMPNFLPFNWIGDQAYISPALVGAKGCALVSFADAGQPGLSMRYRTWIRLQPGTGIPVPVAPSGLKAMALKGNRIWLTWKDNSQNEDGFRIERKRADVGIWFHVKTTGSGTTVCVDDAVNVVLPGKTYTYRVAAYNAGGLSAYSEEVTVTTPGVTAPAAPSNLKAVAVSPSQINLEWEDNSDNEEGFRVERRKDGAEQWVVAAGRVPANLPRFTDYGLQSGQTYTYRVCAFNTAGVSAWSNEVQVTTPNTRLRQRRSRNPISPPSMLTESLLFAVPSAPRGVKVAVHDPSCARITWRGVNRETVYRIYCRLIGEDYTLVGQVGEDICVFLTPPVQHLALYGSMRWQHSTTLERVLSPCLTVWFCLSPDQPLLSPTFARVYPDRLLPPIAYMLQTLLCSTMGTL